MNPLYTLDLLPKNLPEINGYQGCFAINEMPVPKSKNDRPFCFIVNSQSNSEKGEHWMGVCFPANARHKVFFIEPIGFPVHKTNSTFNQYLSNNSSYTEVLPFGVQPLYFTSVSCGYFCVYILNKLSSYNYNLRKLCETEFSPVDRLFNEKKVGKWWHKRKYKRVKK